MVTSTEGEAWKKLLILRTQKTEIHLPNLIGVGAARCGTTSLYHLLNTSSDIYMSPVKELAYWSNRLDSWSQREYAIFFHGGQELPYRGEISPHYLHPENVPSLIHEACPDAKVIIQLRNPVKRTVSHFKHHFNHHKIPSINDYFERAIYGYSEGRTDLRFSHPTSNLVQSFYFEALDRYFGTFGRDRVFVIFLDDLKSDTLGTVARLSDWLGAKLDAAALRVVNRSEPFQGMGSLGSEVRAKLVDLFEDDFAKTCALLGRSPEEFTI